MVFKDIFTLINWLRKYVWKFVSASFVFIGFFYREINEPSTRTCWRKEQSVIPFVLISIKNGDLFNTLLTTK